VITAFLPPPYRAGFPGQYIATQWGAISPGLPPFPLPSSPLGLTKLLRTGWFLSFIFRKLTSPICFPRFPPTMLSPPWLYRMDALRLIPRNLRPSSLFSSPPCPTFIFSPNSRFTNVSALGTSPFLSPCENSWLLLDASVVFGPAQLVTLKEPPPPHLPYFWSPIRLWPLTFRADPPSLFAVSSSKCPPPALRSGFFFLVSWLHSRIFPSPLAPQPPPTFGLEVRFFDL